VPGAFTIRPLVLNPLWGFNRKSMSQKDLRKYGGEGVATNHIASILTPARAG
jgi:hypothetical protein